MTQFIEELRAVLAQHEAKKDALAQSWASVRPEILEVFQQAASTLGATWGNENGDTTSLRWQSHHISFKRDDRRVRIVRTSDVLVEEQYDPGVLARRQVEVEVLGFVRAVLNAGTAPGAVSMPPVLR